MLYKKLFVFISAILLFACAPMKKTASFAQPTPAEFGKAATVAFVDTTLSEEHKETFAYCSGVWISSDTILTALHCARAAARRQEIGKLPAEFQEFGALLLPAVADPTGYTMNYIVESEVTGIDTEPKSKHKSIVLAIDNDHDLAIISATNSPRPEHTWLHVANLNPKAGDKVYVVGHPGGLYFSFFDGMVSAIRETMPHDDSDAVGIAGPFVQVFSGIWHGNSGGPIISEKGEIVGIVSFGTDTPNQGFCIAPPAIKHFIIETYKKNLL